MEPNRSTRHLEPVAAGDVMLDRAKPMTGGGGYPIPLEVQFRTPPNEQRIELEATVVVPAP
jgi:hypothetical protein